MKKFFGSFFGICLGAIIGVYLTSLRTGNFEIMSAVPIVVTLSAVTGIILINSLYHERKFGNLPIKDERSKAREKKFIANASILVLFGSIIFVGIIYYAFGVDSIDTGYLLLYLIAILIFFGSGSLFVKKS